ncbi:MAG: hypothetical protein K9W43_13755 [Candidatus Thorarchaeota archaeon]|nr:hypothetical protein [Candidatus Thorarchaeota archaeon]
MSFVLLSLMTLPYFLSPYVFIVHNPVDDALVAFLGAAFVRPVLYLCTFIGGLVGLVLYIPIHRLYVEVFRDHIVQVGIRRLLLLLIGPYIGILWLNGIQALWNFMCPYPNTGNLLSLFFFLPALFFGIIVSLLNLSEFYRAKKQATLRGFSLQFTMIRRKLDSFRLELIPLGDTTPQPSTSYSIDFM